MPLWTERWRFSPEPPCLQPAAGIAEIAGKKIGEKLKKGLTLIGDSCILASVENIGPSPSGKATDSDSVISKVRILVGQLVKALH